MTNPLRESMAAIIERLLSDATSADAAFRAAEELPWEDHHDEDAALAWHALYHYRDDEDIRARDEDYAERQRRELQKYVDRLRARPGSILGL